MKDFNYEMQRDHSRLFNVHAWTEHKAVKELVNKIFISFSPEDQEKLVPTSNNKGKSDPLKQLRTIMADLYVGWKTDPTLCTSVSRDNNKYKPNSRYNALHIPKRITKIFDALYENAYVDLIKGAYNHENPSLSRNTRYRPTGLLRSLFKDINLNVNEINLHKDKECIVLRDKSPDDSKNKDLEYEDTNLTCSMRSEVQAYNKLMSKHYVDIATLELPYIVRETKPYRGSTKKTLIPIDQSQKFTRRIFSRRSWELNGRWNGGFWQNLPRYMRRDILIDGEPTDEIDYSGLHPTLLALEVGHRLTGDRYDLGTQICADIPLLDQRKVVKQLILITINAKSRNSAIKGFQDKFKGYKKKSLEKLLDAFINKHPFLDNILCSDQGIRLMNVDSNITTHIINQFVRLGIPILPIHDSYIVKTKDRELLKSAMSVACIEIVGADIEAEARSTQETQYLKYATTWRAWDRDFYLDTFSNLQTPVPSKAYINRYDKWKNMAQETIKI